jgi:phospholipid transport system substrate-binding protein
MLGQPLARRDALRIGLVGLASLPFFGTASLAAPGTDETSPVVAVQSFNAALLGVMKAGAGVSFGQRYAMLQPVVDRTFDLDTILRVSVGPHWASMPADQQAALSAAFRRYTIANFVANFDSYKGETIQTAAGQQSVANGDQVVATRIVSPTGSPVELSYVMRQTAAGWKAVDVLAEGSISRVATQRSDFRNLLATGGGPALVASLENKVAALSNGSLA